MQQPETFADLDVARATKSVMKKLPEVTLAFWITKVAATTLGETAGDPVDQHGRHHDVRLHEPRREHQVPFRRLHFPGLGYAGGALLVTAALVVLVALMKVPVVPNVLLFWIAFCPHPPPGRHLG
ncbi:hypothetical protein ABZY14_30550 [Streptomyces sp. NPDC006617]|uniref:hypothetical protein n=1 Tax=Streptomyces sp. NPDC006617 TaxID=3155354 RepID=UPI00339E0A83